MGTTLVGSGGGGGSNKPASAISILDYGGVADGVTPNDTAYAAMIAAMKATGRPGYLPGSPLGWYFGAYAFANPADAIEPGLVIYGDGASWTGIRALDPTKPVVRIADEQSGFRNLKPHHREVPTSTTGAGVALYKAFRPVLDNVEVYRTGVGIHVPAVNASTVRSDLGSGNFAFSMNWDSIRVTRYYQSAADLSGYNAGSTGSNISNFYTTNEDGSDVATTLTSAPAQYGNSIQLANAPAVGQTVYLDTAGAIEQVGITAVTGSGPYTCTTDKSLDRVHASGAACRISKRFRSAGRTIRLQGVDEIVFNQLNVEGTYLNDYAMLVQDANVVVNGWHLERVTVGTYESAFARVYGATSNLSVRGMSPVYNEFRSGGGTDRGYISIGEGASAQVDGLVPRGNIVETGVTVRLARTDGALTGKAHFRGVKTDAATGNGSVPGIPAGTNSRSGAEFAGALTQGDSTQLPVVCQINDQWFRYTNAAGKNVTTATAVPTTGTWAVGDTVWNSAPVAGGVPGWVCTTAGAAGVFVFKAMAALAA